MTDRLLTLAEAAERLNVSTRTLRRLQTDPTFPVIRVLGSLRVPPDALARWVDKRLPRAARAAQNQVA